MPAPTDDFQSQGCQQQRTQPGNEEMGIGAQLGESVGVLVQPQAHPGGSQDDHHQHQQEGCKQGKCTHLSWCFPFANGGKHEVQTQAEHRHHHQFLKAAHGIFGIRQAHCLEVGLPAKQVAELDHHKCQEQHQDSPQDDVGLEEAQERFDCSALGVCPGSCSPGACRVQQQTGKQVCQHCHVNQAHSVFHDFFQSQVFQQLGNLIRKDLVSAGKQ